MPPNVKEVAVALAGLDLSEHVLSKYAPLTSEPIAPPAAAQQQHDDEEAEQTTEVSAKPSAIEHHEQEEEQQQQEVIRSNIDSDSYWDMPSDEPEPTPEEKRQEVIDQILHEEELRQLFSVDHIVANLTRDVATEEEAEQVEQVEEEEVEHVEAEAESYWDMPAEENENTNEPDAAATTKAADDIEDCFSVDHITANLIAEGQRLTEQEQQQQQDDDDDNIIIAPHVNDPTHPNHAYWDHWDTSPQATSYEAKRRALVQQIMEEEAARQMLSCEHILNNMRSVNTATEAGRPTAPTDKGDGNGGEEEAYWSFHHPSDPADTIVASHVTHPNAHPDTIDYWTWDTSPKSTEEQRKVIVDWIMREERARVATSTDVLVDNLINSKERCLPSSSNGNVEESKESAEGYWDW